MKKLVGLAVLILLILFNVQPGFSQTSEEMKTLREDIKALKDGQTAIKKELQDIKTLLRTKQAPPEFKETVISIEGDPFKGDKNAKLVLIEFSDYQ